ncbi:MAG: methyltransferase [Acidimicrobiia bacterium]
MEPAAGSWRDPSSRVFEADGHIVRALDADAAADYAVLAASPLFRDALRERRIVGTRALEPLPATLVEQGWVAALEHDRVPVVTYPFEWTFSMLRDAALLQLDLTEQALADDLITKDATPYNLQFVGSRPMFIDIGSFERLSPGEPWFGYRQFCEQFLNPLLVQSQGIPFQPWLRGEVRGITPAECRSALPFRTRARPSVFVHVGLHAWAERRYAASSRDMRGELRAAGFNPKIVRAQVRRLRKLVRRLRWQPAESTWSEYTKRGHYSDRDLETKEALVRRVAALRHRSQVLDIGANDGRFTDAALATADYAVALDADPLVVDHLYRRLRERGEERIVPVYMDVANLSSPVGWRAKERPAFVERVRPDLVLMLALVHHLAITDMVPFEEIVGLLADLDAEVVVEVPAPEDPMVRRLTRTKKGGAVDRYSIEAFESAAATLFDVIERQVLPSDTRNLYHLRPRR